MEPTDDQVEALARTLAIAAHWRGFVPSEAEGAHVADMLVSTMEPYQFATPRGLATLHSPAYAQPLWTLYRDTARAALRHMAAAPAA